MGGDVWMLYRCGGIQAESSEMKLSLSLKLDPESEARSTIWRGVAGGSVDSQPALIVSPLSEGPR